MGARKLPYAFTEQGIAMLSSVLKSRTAVEVNIRIMRAFVAMRRFVADLIRKAKHSITLIDNYVDDTVLTLLDKRETGVSATIYTQHISSQFRLDVERHNSQYPTIEIKQFNKAHDRFLLIDDEVAIHRLPHPTHKKAKGAAPKKVRLLSFYLSVAGRCYHPVPKISPLE